MAHVVTDLDTTASPERVLGALTDFSPRRFELWPNVDRKYFRLESAGDSTAEVTEGSPVFGGVWERSRYDWSRPGTVRIDVIDSNAFEPGSFWIYEVTPKAERRQSRAHGVRTAAAQLQGAGARRAAQHLRQADLRRRSWARRSGGWRSRPPELRVRESSIIRADARTSVSTARAPGRARKPVREEDLCGIVQRWSAGVARTLLMHARGGSFNEPARRRPHRHRIHGRGLPGLRWRRLQEVARRVTGGPRA